MDCCSNLRICFSIFYIKGYSFFKKKFEDKIKNKIDIVDCCSNLPIF